MDTYIVVIILVIILALLLKINSLESKIKTRISNNVEGFSNAEAIQNLASLYKTGSMKVTNLEVTGNLKVAGSSNVASLRSRDLATGNITGNTITGATLNSRGAINAGGTITGGTLSSRGNVAVGKELTIPANGYIRGAGRLHIKVGERLYLLPRSGVYATRDQGSAGTVYDGWGRIQPPGCDWGGTKRTHGVHGGDDVSFRCSGGRVNWVGNWG